MKVMSKKFTQNEWVLAEALRGANTQIYEKDDGTVAVSLHGTEVAIWNPADNSVKVNSGGFYTATVKRRINQVLDLVGLESMVTQKGGEWFVNAPGKDSQPFTEGMVITAKKKVKSSEDPKKDEKDAQGKEEDKPEKGGPEKDKKEDIDKEKLEKGVEHEKEHDGIYAWLKEYHAEKGAFPPVEDFRKKIAEDHLAKDPNYYAEPEVEKVGDKGYSINSKKNVVAMDLSGVKVYDLGEEVLDRYTVVIGDDVYGMSEYSNRPDGFNMWLGKLEDFDVSGLGDLIDVADVSETVRNSIESRLKEFEG